MQREIHLYSDAISHIKEAILRSQYKSVRLVNTELLSLYYAIGGYVSEKSRNSWGNGAIKIISDALQKELPGLRGFSERSIKNMRQFYEEWCNEINRQPMASDLEIDENKLLLEIRQPMAAKMIWNEFISIPFSHHIEILNKTKTIEEREFYIHECYTNSWSKYQLREVLKSDLFRNKGGLPNNFSETLSDKKQVLKATKAFKEEYLLDFINVEPIGEQYKDIDERVIENSIIRNIQKFIMTFGNDFTFVGNQYRIVISGVEMFIDLLFYNRELNALVAIELKTGEFKPAYLGQLNTYLSALDAKVKKEHEKPSIGIILCKGMDKTFVEFAIRDYEKPMGVAIYRTNEEVPEKYKKALPDIQSLHKILIENEDK